MTQGIEFDADGLAARAAKAGIGVLRRMGAYIRRVAQSKVRQSAKPSQPGEPPHTRRGALKRGILFGVDRTSNSVVVGPSFRFVGTSMQAHEFGNAPEKPLRNSAAVLKGSFARRANPEA